MIKFENTPVFISKTKDLEWQKFDESDDKIEEEFHK